MHLCIHGRTKQDEYPKFQGIPFTSPPPMRKNDLDMWLALDILYRGRGDNNEIALDDQG